MCSKRLELFAIFCVGIGLRAIVSLHQYSGAAKPPMYGDYEAQRHWQEVTLNIPIQQWYKNTTANDLLYWGLDYPPLTAYHSYGVALTARQINDSFVALQASRGIESAEHKSFMRLTVLLSDALLYLPACLVLAMAMKSFYSQNILAMFLLPAIYPGQILIDNGHFQYNNMSLGLAALAVAAILKDRNYMAAFFFTLSLSYKQMQLYHALPFFFYLLSACFAQKGYMKKFLMLLKIGAVVVLTEIVIFMPWLSSVDSISTVLARLFPLGRGVFEDKVANIWCALNTLYKFKSNFTNQQMALICLCATASLAIPLNLHLFFRNGKQRFLLCLTNTAMVFYLFSFQVHEKSILLAAFPAFCLFAAKPFETIWFLEITVFSMLPLFIKDELVVAYLALSVIFHICLKLVPNASCTSKLLQNCYYISLSAMIVLTAAALFISPPVRYPDLWALLISVFSCAHFVVFLIFGAYSQFRNLDVRKKTE